MEKFFLAIIFILCTTSSCVGIIYGDFSNDNLSEGTGIECALKDAFFQRLSKRIQKKLGEKKNPSKIKKFWFW
jgi:hypothetical protein